MDHGRIGKYRIVDELGRGTMGEVYKAHDPVLNRHVALKTLATLAGPGDEAHQRFHREAQAAALLNHPNIVTVYDFGEQKGLLYMAMELLEGGDLREAMDRDQLKTLDRKLDVIDAVLAALDYAHARGVVHRDVKPANIHIGPEGNVKLMDFGLARVGASEMTQEGIVLGTPNYMSPEQALGDRVDGRSDLFSVGAVLYELLTGHKPFEAETTPSVLFQVVHKEATPVRVRSPQTPAPLAAVVERALCKERERRFASAGEMRSALTAARAAKAEAGSGTGSGRALPSASDPRVAGALKPPSSSSPRAKGPRRRRRVSRPLLVAAALVVLAAGGAWFLERWQAWPFAPRRAPEAEVSTLTSVLVSTQVQLAQRELDDKNYRAAVQQAASALRLSGRHARAQSILEEARRRLLELETAVGEARSLAERGEVEAASQQLSRVLELDPRHPAATELSARLNSAFQVRAQEAAASMQSSREKAARASGTAEFAAAAERARAADAFVAGGEFANAAAAFLEARDGFDRARRAADDRRRRARSETAGAREDHSPGEGAEAGAEPLAAAAAPVEAPARGFLEEETQITRASGGRLEGFDTRDVSSQREPEFRGRFRFEVQPPAVRSGDPFVVRLHVANDGRRALRVRALSLATVVDGERIPIRAKPLQRELGPQRATLLAEFSGVWQDATSWALEAEVTSDRDETISARLRAE